MFVFLKQKTAYEMRISDWSSDVCSSDLLSSKQHSKPRRSPAVGRRKTARDFKRLPETVPSLPGRAGGLHGPAPGPRRSEERRVGKRVSVRVDLGGRRTIKKKN